MQVREFIEVLNYIEESIKKHDLIGEYQKLVLALEQIRTAPNPDSSKNVNLLEDEIIRIQAEIEPQNWNYTKRKILHEYDSNGLLGQKAVGRILLIFSDYAADPSSIQNELQGIINQLSDILRNVEILKNSLLPLNTDRADASPDVNTIQLIFQGQAAIENIDQLEKYAHDWRLILHNFSRLISESAAPAQIKSIQEGSTVIVVIGTPGMVIAIGWIVNKILDLYERILKLKKASLEIKNLELGNKKLEQELVDAEKQQIKHEVEKATHELLEKYQEQIVGNDKHEIGNQLNSSVRDIYNFVVNGGRVEITQTGDSENSDSSNTTNLDQRYSSIKNEIEKVGNLPLLAAPDPVATVTKAAMKPVSKKTAKDEATEVVREQKDLIADKK
jgi:hypothetical protein